VILSTHLRSLAATAVIFSALPLCLPHLGWMILWLLACCPYLVLVMIGCIDIEHAQKTQLSHEESPAHEWPAEDFQ
jgi:hypothetical protein